jgi:hypothetical protein
VQLIWLKGKSSLEDGCEPCVCKSVFVRSVVPPTNTAQHELSRLSFAWKETVSLVQERKRIGTLKAPNIQECAPVVGLIPPNASCECEVDLDSVHVRPIEEHELVRLKRQHQDRSQPQHSVSGQDGRLATCKCCRSACTDGCERS